MLWPANSAATEMFEGKPFRPLVLRPAPVDGESVRSYLKRAAYQNALPSAADLIRHIPGHRDLRAYTEWPCLETASQLFLVPIDRLSLMSLHKVGDRHELHGVRLPSHGALSKEMRVCPQCLAEEEVHRSFWQVSQIIACPSHGALLKDRCTCGAPLSWSHPGFHCGNCGISLSSLSHDKAAPALFEYVRVAKKLLDGGHIRVGETELGFEDWVYLTEWLGGHITRAQDSTVSKRKIGGVSAQQVGYAALGDLQNTIKSLLGDNPANRAHRLRNSIVKFRGDKWKQEALRVVSEVSGRKWRADVSAELQTSDLIDTNKVLELIGITARQFQRIRVSPKFQNVRTRRGAVRVYARKDVQSFAEDYNDRLHTDQLASELGCGRKRAAMLLAAGEFDAKPGSLWGLGRGLKASRKLVCREAVGKQPSKSQASQIGAAGSLKPKPDTP